MRVVSLSLHVNREFLDVIANMPLKYVLTLAFCLGTLVLATPVSLHKNATVSGKSTNQVNPVINLASNFGPILNDESSTSLSAASSAEDIQIHCNGASYGFDLDMSDCEQAKAYLASSPDEVQWPERHTGVEGVENQGPPLPYRSMGDNASCYVQPVLMDGATAARASPNHVRNAAAMIQNRCFSGGKLQGGMATNIGKRKIFCCETNVSSLCFARTLYQTSEIDSLHWLGGDNNLAVIMGAYASPSAIRCYGSLPGYSCLDMLQEMPATTEMEIFGPSRTSPATVLLPQNFTSSMLINQVLIY